MLKDYFSKTYSSPTVIQNTKEGLAELFRSRGQYNAGDPFIYSSVGLFSYLASIDSEGKRSNYTSAYYKSIEFRQNLYILINLFVERLSGGGGVEFLEKYSINIVVHLSGVRQNFQNMWTALNLAELDTKDSLKYTAIQSGSLSLLGVYTYVYLPLPLPDRSALEILFISYTAENLQEYRTIVLDPKQPSAVYLSVLGQMIYTKDLNNKTILAALPGKFVTLRVVLSQLLSRRSDSSISINPEIASIIDSGYLSNPLNLEVIVQYLLELLEQLPKFCNPAADFQGDLDTYFAGTCSMLPRERDGVVDLNSRVCGIERLRVLDMGATPLVSTANLQATVYAFAEKAADLIKEDWKSE
ncbi:hypothetical protein BDV36DRAFT_310303 [Aspergillus pseudocaelatus]|uniref:Glucose-methanol-choline oxidoreductase C-terminal domain-containing protein n=1 Tax=Aspergillus pseudocaelatus TaxID=1825620 RepID=A0ABQ6X1R9_9EURO|nr:hypothetical protein BDV36DRAFT_310303 [Aspergillus pseudocaelatus]